MDWLTFASKAIEALAWPVGSIILVLVLRDEIRKVVPFLKRLKAGPLEAEFEREVSELKASTEQISTETLQLTQGEKPKDFLFQLAQLHPRSAILESWVRVEAAARAALASTDQSHEISTHQPAARLAETLARKEILDQTQVTLFHELRRLRNDAAHLPDFEPTLNSVSSYIELSSYLQNILKRPAK